MKYETFWAVYSLILHVDKHAPRQNVREYEVAKGLSLVVERSPDEVAPTAFRETD